jgi:hypothetical protein
MFAGAVRSFVVVALAALLSGAPGISASHAQSGLGGPGFAPGGLVGDGPLPGLAGPKALQLAPPGGAIRPGEQGIDLLPPRRSTDTPQNPLGASTGPQPQLNLPPISGYAPSSPSGQLAVPSGEITLAAKLTEDSPEIGRGLVWRVFGPQAGPDGKLPLIASAQGGTSVFQLEPGSYLIHAAFGRAGATKRITIGREPTRESVVLEAGGLKLDAILSGGVRIPPSKLKFSIYEAEVDARGERALIIPNVSPNTVVRLNAGTYHVVSTYGSVNAVIRADIHVEAGKLTEATVEHRAAQLTLKLVREEGGEAIADTAWSVLTDSGDIVRENVGAFASMVLAEGNYTAIAKNRDRIYQRDFAVTAGRNQDVEVFAHENAEIEASALD